MSRCTVALLERCNYNPGLQLQAGTSCWITPCCSKFPLYKVGLDLNSFPVSASLSSLFKRFTSIGSVNLRLTCRLHWLRADHQ